MTSDAAKKNTIIQRHFAPREVQITIAFLTVVALLAGVFLQSASSAVTAHYGLHTFFTGLFLVVGYVVIVMLIAIFFTHRLLGPFKRIEYQMKLIADGELSRRITVRSKDDLHVRNFAGHANRFISNFEEMSKDYNAMSSLVSKKLDEVSSELSREGCDCKRLRAELLDLQRQMREFRERW
ncbi:MAG: methyl-accepting chemotaxis protein [Deltaproteobacteria bacterium]|nr:methyl-accepting chemotaxis protein [Deltaproteobacteria bacterium]